LYAFLELRTQQSLRLFYCLFIAFHRFTLPFLSFPKGQPPSLDQVFLYIAGKQHSAFQLVEFYAQSRTVVFTLISFVLEGSGVLSMPLAEGGRERVLRSEGRARTEHRGGEAGGVGSVREVG
jgi:hypothetical protein